MLERFTLITYFDVLTVRNVSLNKRGWIVFERFSQILDKNESKCRIADKAIKSAKKQKCILTYSRKTIGCFCESIDCSYQHFNINWFKQI